MYSRKMLKALEQTLQAHRAMVWIDPVTNQIAVKRITPVQDDDRSGHYQEVTA